MPLSSEELALWVILNRGTSNAFKGATFEQVHAEICQALDNKSLVIDVDESGYVNGIAICEIRVHIKEILVNEPTAFGKLLKMMRILFPFVNVFTGFRRNGKYTIYRNPDKILKLTNKEHIYG